MDFAQRAATTKCLLSFRFIVSCVGALDVGHHSAPEQACSIWSSCLVLPPGCRFFFVFFFVLGLDRTVFFLVFPPRFRDDLPEKKRRPRSPCHHGLWYPLVPCSSPRFRCLIAAHVVVTQSWYMYCYQATPTETSPLL